MLRAAMWCHQLLLVMMDPQHKQQQWVQHLQAYLMRWCRWCQTQRTLSRSWCWLGGVTGEAMQASRPFSNSAAAPPNTTVSMWLGAQAEAASQQVHGFMRPSSNYLLPLALVDGFRLCVARWQQCENRGET